MAYACKEHDHIVTEKYIREGYVDEWDEIDDLCNPYIWMSKVMAFANGIQHGNYMNEEVFEEFKKMLLRTYPYVCRHLTSKEMERAKCLLAYDLI